jgi:uncharacterized protein
LHEKIVTISKKFQQYIGSHGYEHTERVIEICKVLGKALKADMSILIPAAILHDIGRERDNHAYHSAEIAREILRDLNYPMIDEIIHAIEVHSFSAGGQAKTLEAQILSDADKLDAIGAIGIYRAAMFSYEHKRPWEDFIEHFQEKLLKLKDLTYTDKAKSLAEGRHQFLKAFLEEFKREIAIES